ncbi:MAG: hypothetical protein DBX59_05225 [Bacillota bacterium]|nr:MAG: hypothetical protein DBX59_05225 [Bacillota bacterium]
MNTRYYLKNGTISVEPINEDNADFFIVNYEINGERKFFYKNDEILLNIDCELVSLYDKFRDIYFPDTEGYYKQLNSIPIFVQEAGQNSDCAIDTNLFNKLIGKFFNIFGNDLYRHLYLVDCQYIIGTIQNHLCEMNDLFIRFYVDICETTILCNDRFTDKTFHLTSLESRLLSATVESYFIKAYSILDLLTKIIYEIENPIKKFNKYEKLISNEKIWGDRKKTKFNNEPETLFEECELVKIIESLRNETVHNGSWELNPKLFVVNKENNITEKFMLFPDFDQGRLSCVKNRKHFFSKSTKINDIFVKLHFEFMNRLLKTVKKILAYTT